MAKPSREVPAGLPSSLGTAPQRGRSPPLADLATAKLSFSRAILLPGVPNPLRTSRCSVPPRRGAGGVPRHPYLKHPVDELTGVHVDLDLLKLQHAAGDVLGEPPERLLALLRRGPQRVADGAALDELVVVHREGEVLVARKGHVRHAVLLVERLRQVIRDVRAGELGPLEADEVPVPGHVL